MIPLVQRVKLLLAERGTAVAMVLVVVGLVAVAGAAWTITHPPTVEVSERVATHTIGTDVETSTVVTGNTTLWDRGTRLEDKPLYPLKSAPELTVRIDTKVPSGEEVRVSQELTLVYKATKDDAVFWEAERELLSKEHTVTDGRAASSATFDVRKVRSHLNEINGEITGIGRAQAYLVLNVSYQTDDYSGTLSKTAPMAILSTGYWISGSLDAENTHQTPITREVTKPPDREKAMGLGLLGFLALGGAGGVVYVSSRRLDAEIIREMIDRERYREWVSAGRLGQFVTGQDVAMDSLKDLVDVAIDSNERVIHDTQRDLYAVVDDNVIYFYDPYHTEPEVDTESEIGVPVTYDGGHTAAFRDGPRPAPPREEAGDEPATDEGSAAAPAEEAPSAETESGEDTAASGSDSPADSDDEGSSAESDTTAETMAQSPSPDTESIDVAGSDMTPAETELDADPTETGPPGEATEEDSPPEPSTAGDTGAIADGPIHGPESEVAVDRVAELTHGQLILTYRLTTGADGPVDVEFLDRLPDGVGDVRSCRGLWGYKPARVRPAAAGLAFAARIHPGEESVVKIAVGTGRPITEDDPDRITDAPIPRVHRAVPADDGSDPAPVDPASG